MPPSVQVHEDEAANAAVSASTTRHLSHATHWTQEAGSGSGSGFGAGAGAGAGFGSGAGVSSVLGRDCVPRALRLSDFRGDVENALVSLHEMEPAERGTSWLINDIGEALREAGRKEEAKALFTEALAARRAKRERRVPARVAQRDLHRVVVHLFVVAHCLSARTLQLWCWEACAVRSCWTCVASVLA